LPMPTVLAITVLKGELPCCKPTVSKVKCFCEDQETKVCQDQALAGHLLEIEQIRIGTA